MDIELLERVARLEETVAKLTTTREIGDTMMLTDKQTAKMCGIGRSTLHRLVSRGAFPKPVKAGGRATRWRRQDIESWIARRK